MSKVKKEWNIVGHRKIFFGISIAIMLIGVIFNIIFGVSLDINFKGGTMIRYSFQGELDEEALRASIDGQLDEDFELTFSTGDPAVQTDEEGNPVLDEQGNEVVVPTGEAILTMTEAMSMETQEALDAALEEGYADNRMTKITSNSLPPSMGQQFFIKCIVAIVLASAFLLIYVALRFRKIGGLSAGVMSLIALLHDVLVAYFVFVIFRIPLDENFVAVVLSILGYSLNATIVIYDRIRENRRIMSSDATIGEIVNTSINQSMTRSVNTSLCTFIAIAVVAVLALVYNLSSIVSFALPMMLGVVSGCYSSTFIAGPLWVCWKERKGAKEKKSGKKAKA